MCARYVCKSAEHKINLWLPCARAVKCQNMRRLIDLLIFKLQLTLD